MAMRKKKARKEHIPEQMDDEMMAELISEALPPEVEALTAIAEMMDGATPDEEEQRLANLAKLVADRRDAAVSARKVSGIETIWREDIDYYEGRDQFNKGTELTKPQSLTGGIQTNETATENDGCTEFFNITRPFVDAADARMGDILLPAGDWNFSMDPTPVPELAEAAESKAPIADPDTGAPVAGPDGAPATEGDVAELAMITAFKKVRKAELWVRDQLTECRFHAESRLTISDAAKIGTGVLKGPYPESRTTSVLVDGALEIRTDTVFASKRIDPFNFFPASDCDGDIQTSSHVIERAHMTGRQLSELTDGYREEGIKAVLKEGPGKRNLEAEDAPTGIKSADDDRFEVWYHYGDIQVRDLALLDENVNPSYSEDGEEDDEGMDAYVSATIVMVNDTIIKGHLNPLTSGGFPYDVFPWQKVAGQVWGIGVARQGRVPQKMFLASSRALMNNMALSSAPILGVLQHAIIPLGGGGWQLRGGKIFALREQSEVRSIKDAITSIEVPSMQAELTANIQLALKMMEDATGVTFLLQGQQGSAPDTVGGMQMLQQNASAFLRRVARLYDEYITERHIHRYYQALLLEEGMDDAKGDLRIRALGSSALLERETQQMQLQQIMQLAEDPSYQLSKPSVAHEMLRLWGVEPAKFKMTPEEVKAAQEAQPAPAPQVQAAQIRTEGALQQQQLKSQDNMAKLEKDVDRDRLYAEGVRERNMMTNDMKNKELEMKLQLAMLEYANRNETQLADLKTQLARDSMKLQVQKELSGVEAEVPQITAPIAEPEGRAPDGQAFQR